MAPSTCYAKNVEFTCQKHHRDVVILSITSSICQIWCGLKSLLSLLMVFLLINSVTPRFESTVWNTGVLPPCSSLWVYKQKTTAMGFLQHKFSIKCHDEISFGAHHYWGDPVKLEAWPCDGGLEQVNYLWEWTLCQAGNREFLTNYIKVLLSQIHPSAGAPLRCIKM